MEFKKSVLDNGLTIAAEVNPDSAATAVGFFAKTGSRDETAEIAGVSHFLEHMMFKGSERRSPGDVNLEFDEMGAVYNAFTTEENTVYYATVLPEFQLQAVDILADILRPSLRTEDFEMEKGVILDEIARYEDIPSFRCYDKLMALHFRNHPLGNSILGTPDSIKALKRDDMQAYFESRYSPGNVTVAATGNVDFDALVDKVTQMCSHWQPCEAPRERPSVACSPTTRLVSDPKVSRAHLGLMSAAPSCQDERRYAAHLLSAIIGDTSGSRLYYALIEPALADEAHMTFDPLDGAGGFITFLSCDPQRVTEALDATRTVLQEFAAEGPTETELQVAKNKIASSATVKGELPMGRLTDVGFDWVYRNEYAPLADRIDALFETTVEEVAAVATEFDLTAFTTLALGPMQDI